MKTLILTDTETTGIDPKTEHAIEVAAVLFDVETASVLEAFSSLIYAEANAAASINRIDVATLAKALPAKNAWARVSAMVSEAIDMRGPVAFMAHRAEFDRGFYPSELAARIPWVCSKFDVEWPRSRVGASLVEVALAHDVPVHANHRALTDCMLLAKVLERTAELGHDLTALLTRAMRPKALFRITDTSFDEARNVLAKAAGFRWEKPYWVRSLAIADAASLPFAVTQMSP